MWPHENSSALQLSLNLCTVEMVRSSAYEKKPEGAGECVCVCVALVSFSSPSTAHTEATESRSLLNSTAPKQRLTHRQWRVFSTDNCCGLSSELACRLGPDTYSPHYTHKHRHAFRSEQTKKKTAHTCRHVQKPALMCNYSHKHTHTNTNTHPPNSCVEQIAITGLLCSGNLNMHSSFALSALAFVLHVKKSHKAFLTSKTENIRNSKLQNTNCGSKGRRWVDSEKNLVHKQHSIICAPLNVVFSSSGLLCVSHLAG